MSATAGVRFSEEMRGHVAFGEGELARGVRAGRGGDTRLILHLTIEIVDLPAFVAAARHEARATGWVGCDALGDRLPIERGTFNLFPAGGDPARGRMLYHLSFRDGVGHPVALAGEKIVGGPSIARLWHDTTTLRARLLSGQLPGDEGGGGPGHRGGRRPDPPARLPPATRLVPGRRAVASRAHAGDRPVRGLLPRPALAIVRAARPRRAPGRRG